MKTLWEAVVGLEIHAVAYAVSPLELRWTSV